MWLGYRTETVSEDFRFCSRTFWVAWEKRKWDSGGKELCNLLRRWVAQHRGEGMGGLWSQTE